MIKTENIQTILRSDDFSCPSCVAKIEKALKTMPGVEDAEVHFSTGRVEVLHNPEIATVEALIEAISRTGYTARASSF